MLGAAVVTMADSAKAYLRKRAVLAGTVAPRPHEEAEAGLAGEMAGQSLRHASGRFPPW
jgi:hypothetical protein